MQKKKKRKYFGTTVLLREMESRYFIKPGQTKASGKSTTSWILRVVFSPLKTSNAVLEFVVPFSITPVFLPRFLKIGKALSQQVTRHANNESLEPSLTVDNVSAKLARLLLA